MNTDESGAQSEEIIDNAETNNVRRNAGSGGAGLFDQLRAKEEERERVNDEKRAAGLGVVTLNDEDVLHVNKYIESKDRKRKEREAEEHAELDMFQREKQMRKDGMVVVEGDEEKKKKVQPAQQAKKEVMAPIVPVMLKKKKKESKKESKKEVKKEAPAAATPSLGGLLAGYGSDSDSD